MKSYNIAVIPGDGTGPEVVREGMKVLDVACQKYEVSLNYEQYDFGALFHLDSSYHFLNTRVLVFKYRNRTLTMP